MRGTKGKKKKKKKKNDCWESCSEGVHVTSRSAVYVSTERVKQSWTYTENVYTAFSCVPSVPVRMKSS